METQNRQPPRILVVRGGAIGDFVLTLPVLAALRAKNANARIGLLASRECGDLAVAGNLVDECRPLEGREWAGFFVENGIDDPDAGKWVGRFDEVISFLNDPKKVFERNICLAGASKFIAGCSRPIDGIGVPASVQLLQALEPARITDACATPNLEIFSCKLKDEVLAVHPGSGSASKNWPEENWVQFLQDWLEGSHSELLIIAGEAEADRVDQLCAQLPEGRVRLLLCRPLTEVARALGGCRAFLGHDSGITHLAAAIGLPGAVLWAETDKCVWGPSGGRMKFLHQPITPGLVLKEVTTFFE